MNLTSCGNCGIVLDRDRIPEPDIWDEEDGSVKSGVAAWDGDDWVPTIECPACSSRILYRDGNIS